MRKRLGMFAERDAAPLTALKLVMPKTKQMESRMLDLPLPFKPVMALKLASKPETCVRTG